MIIIGMDLSGPSNSKDSVVAVFKKHKNGIKFIKLLANAKDQMILDEVYHQSQMDEVVIGMDAPLSYQDGGGDRKGDKELRKFIVSLGMKSGSIMPPTLNRMVYLTLRGIKLTREIEKLKSQCLISIVEVHPGAVMGARIPKSFREYILTYKQNSPARQFLKEWLKEQGLTQIPNIAVETSHSLDACAAALGAWHWKDEAFKPQWLCPAIPPLHPYDYCC